MPHGGELRRIRNAEALISIFGRWPSFHDAEIHRLRLDRGAGESPSLEVDIHVFEMTSNDHVTVRNPRGERESGTRRLLIGVTDGGRALTLVIEATLEPTTWLIVTGWEASSVERKILAG